MNALGDIADTSQEKVKVTLESWFEVLKNVMRLWCSGSDIASASKMRS